MYSLSKLQFFYAARDSSGYDVKSDYLDCQSSYIPDSNKTWNNPE